MSELAPADLTFLERAIVLAERSLQDDSLTPFGAILVVNGEVIGEGLSAVVKNSDPTAHAEVEALREAGRNSSRHLFPDATMDASREPCPMCLAGCYWAQVQRLVFGANSHDIGRSGFEDLWFYREFAIPRSDRKLREIEVDGELGDRARSVLQRCVTNLPFEVEKKL